MENVMQAIVSRKRFGPWALITGASSGIGKEFARQIAASGINIVLAARREGLLEAVARDCSREFRIEHRVVAVDLAQDGFMAKLIEATRDIDIGLVISNAGGANPGPFLAKSHEALLDTLHIGTRPHVELAHHFGRKLSERRTGGILIVGAMAADKGVPYMASDAAAKAYAQVLAVSLHGELKTAGVHVTALLPGATETPALANFGLDPKTMPMKPMQVDQCVREGLAALARNHAIIVPGRMNRIMRRLVPASMTRAIMSRMLHPASAKPAAAIPSHGR